MSKIEWTGKTWNPVVGCSIVSPGCTNCYAMKMAARLERMLPPGNHYAGLTKKVNGNAVWTGKLALAPEKTLTEPLRVKKPTTWFVNSMGDLFHEDVPDAWIDKVFAVMALCPQHTFQVLTKRSKRMREYCQSDVGLRVQNCIDYWDAEDSFPSEKWETTPWVRNNFPLPNVWLGVSAEDQTRADERIQDLLATPAAVRFVSAEPLLGPIDFTSLRNVDLGEGQRWLNAIGTRGSGCVYEGGDTCSVPRLDWIIVGGESGPDARPMHPDWARSIRDQCKTAGVAFLFKQWGEWCPGENCDYPAIRSERVASLFGNTWDYATLTPRQSEEMHIDDAPDLYRAGKARAGRLLDGIEHNSMPEALT